MNLFKFLNEKASVEAQNRLLKIVAIVLLFCLCVCSLSLVYALNYQRVIIVPPGLKSASTITGDAVDEHYVVSFARYISQLAFTFTPGSAKPQFEELLLSFSPESFPQGKVMLYDLAERVAMTKLCSVFYPHKFELDQKARRIEVTGNRLQSIDNRAVSNGVVTYMINYAVNDGKFAIIELAEKTDNNRSVKK